MLPRRCCVFLFVLSFFNIRPSWKARFALSSSSVFNRNDTITDSERFYNSILEYLEDPDEADDVNTLMAWWNR